MEVKEKGEDGEECVRACVCSMRVSGADQSAQLLGYRSSSDDDDRMKGEKRGGCARCTEGLWMQRWNISVLAQASGCARRTTADLVQIGPSTSACPPLHVHEHQEHAQHCIVGRGPERRRRPC